jgi:hypothetical protein
MTWEVRWGSILASGDGVSVQCSDERVERLANAEVEAGPVGVTPTGPWVTRPDEAVTFLAFSHAMFEAGQASGVMLVLRDLPPIPDVPYDPDVVY